ncbi:MAG: hypothetical protein ACTHM2_05095 [Afipia sp.]
MSSYNEGRIDGATAERDRFKTVMSSEAYKGREAAAHHALFGSSMSGPQIISLLQTFPVGGGSARGASWSKSIAKANARVNVA